MWIRSFQHPQDLLSVFPMLFVSSVPKLPLFSHPPTLFLQGPRLLNQVSFLLMGSLSILFRQCSYPVILRKILTELQVYYSSSLFFSGGLISSFGVDHISSFCFTYLPMWISYPRLSYLFTSPSSYPECWRYLGRFVFPFSIRSSYFEVVISFKPFNSTGAIPPFNQSFNGVSFEWALTHRSFPRILPDSSIFLEL